MVTAADNSVFPERRPKAWTLYGWTTDGEHLKLDEVNAMAQAKGLDEYQRIKLDEVNVNAGGPYDLTTGNLKERMYFIQSAGFQKPMNRFRLEISECFDKDDDATMQIAEFHF